MKGVMTVVSLAVLVEAVRVDIPGLGGVEGTSYHVKGTSVESFRGIPYAAPPVGNLRWQPPSPPHAWSGVRSAKDFGNTCYGSGCYTTPHDSEDCLFLNVFRPAHFHGRLPVMVWIHGGAYANGCGDVYAGDSLVASSDHPLIVVTLNYRLNVFGFLGSHRLRASDGSTGNFGIQDQRMALEWVSKHIAAFGGDPRHVTIFGESAGAGSVAAHMVMPKSFGLYRSAIADSGAGAIWNGKPLSLAENVTSTIRTAVGCGANPECLRHADATALSNASNAIPTIPGGPYITWSPVVDGIELANEPWVLLQLGLHVQDVDLLLGVNRDESAFFFISNGVPPPNSTEDDFNKALLPYISDEHLGQLRVLYQPTKYPYPTDLGNYSFWWWAGQRAQSDHEFTCPNRRTLSWLSRGNPNAYAYLFVHPTSTYTGIPGTGKGALTVPHASELAYVFGCANMTPSAVGPAGCSFSNQGEQDLSDLMASTWTRFAVLRSPAGNNLPTWPRYRHDQYMVFDVARAHGGTGLRVISNLRTEQCNFWDQMLEPVDSEVRLGGDGGESGSGDEELLASQAT